MIGSNTKLFTATALAILQEEGKLSFNDRVRKWMPEFKLKDPLASEEIIITDLLSHRLGFQTFQGDFTYWTSNLTSEEVIAKMALVDAPFDFRTRWGYCNAAFLTAGKLISRVTDSDWSSTVRSKIIEPLHMDRTLTLAKDLDQSSNHATPYTVDNGKLKEEKIAVIDNLAPAGSMSSSVADLSKWVMAQLNMGKAGNEQVIPARAILTTRRPNTIMGIDPRDNQSTHFYVYAAGLMINDRNESLVFSHTGGVNGFLSSVMFIPEKRVGIIVLTNTDQNNLFADATNEIRDAFLGLPYQDYLDQSLARTKNQNKAEAHRVDSLRSEVNKKRKPGLELASFAGKYTNTLYGDIEIKLENKLLNIHFSNHPDLTAKLEYLDNNIFLCTYSDPIFGIKEFPFKIDDGKVKGFTLTVNDFVEMTPYEFVKE